MKGIQKLRNILRLCRAHDSEGEAVFVKKYLRGAEVFTDEKQMALAYVIEVPPCDMSHDAEHSEGNNKGRILWCAHVDTMHPKDAPVRQTIVHDQVSGLIYKDERDTLKMPLGADNGAGCWLLLEMIRAKVPGTYLFHRGEERGGIGSVGMTKHHAGFLQQFQYAIAFDRRGTGDVITEMMCGRTCSDLFAQSLSDTLNGADGMFQYMPDNTGSFTDTANYRRLIPECTNVSVGYDHEHGPNEVLDVFHLFALRDALVKAFKEGTGDLAVARGVDDVDEYDRYGWGNYKNYLTDPYDADAQFCLDPRDSSDVCGMDYRDVVKWVRMSSPEDVADLLMSMAEEAVYRDYAINHEEI